MQCTGVHFNHFFPEFAEQLCIGQAIIFDFVVEGHVVALGKSAVAPVAQ